VNNSPLLSLPPTLFAQRGRLRMDRDYAGLLAGEPGSETLFEPRIIAFLCNWCTYAGADLAGTSWHPVPAQLADRAPDVQRCGGSLLARWRYY